MGNTVVVISVMWHCEKPGTTTLAVINVVIVCKEGLRSSNRVIAAVHSV